MAWTSERGIDVPDESAAFDDAKRSFSTCRKSAASVANAAKSAYASATQAPRCKLIDRTSRMESHANGPHPTRSGFREKHRRPIYAS
jgi:hypothetical protein